MMKFPGLLKKYTQQQKQTTRTAEPDSSFSSANSEDNDLRRSPRGSKDQRGRSKSPGGSNKIYPVDPVSKDSGDLTNRFTATQPTGIIKSGITCIHEAHVPRLKDEGESSMSMSALNLYDRNPKDLSTSERSDESNRDRKRVSWTQSSEAATRTNVAQDEGSSSGNMSEAPSSNQRPEAASKNSPYKASSSSTQIERLAPRNFPSETVQTEPTDNVIGRRSKKGLNVAFGDTNVLWPPPPCSQCDYEHHSDKPSSRSFSSQKLKIATDSYNSVVGNIEEQLFKGFLAGRPVYVSRRVSEKRSNFFSEVNILKGLQHQNIVTLRGFCDEDDSQALVFNFVCNRDLFFNLSSKGLKRETISWPHRTKLAIELARGLNYLHKSGIIHGNVNSKNIFVTHDFVPVIGDFSFSRRVDHVRNVILQDRSKDMKARGYLAPDYVLGKTHSEKQDVYAFGVILFELISGRAAYDRNCEPRYLDRWGIKALSEFEPNDRAKLVETMADPRLNSNFCEYEMLRMILVAKLCTRRDPQERPVMTEVLDLLLVDGISDVDRIEEKHAPQPAPPNRQQKTTRGSRPVMQQRVGGERLQWSNYEQNPIKILHMPFKLLCESVICVGGGIRFGFGPVSPTASPKRNRDRSNKSTTKTTAKKTASVKPPFVGHPFRAARSKNPRPQRPRSTVYEGYDPGKPSLVSARRPHYGKRPATPGHRFAKGKSGIRMSDDGVASSSKSHPGFPITPKPVFKYYNRKNPGKNPVAFGQRREDRSVRFAQPKPRSRHLILRFSRPD